MTTGIALKLERTARRVKGVDLARVMGVSGAYVSAIEARHVVADDLASRYRTALATFPTIPTSQTAQEVA